MEELVKRALERDADAFSDLMLSQMQEMYKIARTILSNEEDAADAISDTILSCWEKLHQLKEVKYFRTWMTRILINKCRDILRKRERLFLTDKMQESAAVDRGFENIEWEQALESLDEHYRTVVVLYYAEGFKASEISEILQIPESTVRTRLARAREKMAEHYGVQRKRRRTL